MIHVQPPPVNTDAGAEFDFETASEAGYVWNEATHKWGKPYGASGNKTGLGIVGSSVYTEHPTARVLTLSYKLPIVWQDLAGNWRGGGVKRRWKPGQPNPQELFDYLAAGGTIEAFNVMFERLVWENICVPKYGWPPLQPHVDNGQLRCAMAKSRVNSLPGALGPLSDVLRLPIPKDKDGKRLLDKFSKPRNPTKNDPRVWVMPEDDPDDFAKLENYCDTDLDAEAGASHHPWMQPMTLAELQFWMIDQEINWRGVNVDRKGLKDCIAVLGQALTLYGDEFREITGGLNPTQLEATKGWLRARGVHLDKMDEAALDEALEPGSRVLPPGPSQMRRVLEIRQLIGSASVKKIYSMDLQATADDRLQNLIVHHGARTGRPTGEGPQPLNLPKAGPDLRWCLAPLCNRPYRAAANHCPWCTTPAALGVKAKWGAAPKEMPAGTPAAIEYVLEVMALHSLELLEWYFGDALLCIMGCVRGLFVAKPGHDLIASDFSSIEAVVIAMLAGEQWRIEAFQQNQPIYLLSASKITGRTLQNYLDYYDQHGEHHPDRSKIGKVAELANGFGGWIGSSKAFGSTEPDDVIKGQILAWREASPAIVDLWGGQFRGSPFDRSTQISIPELKCFGEVVRPAQLANPKEFAPFGFEGAFVQAILHPGSVQTVRGIQFQLRGHRPAVTERTWDGILEDFYDRTVIPGELGRMVVTLLSGRELTYHQPYLTPATRDYARPGEWAISYMTWNTNPKYGPMGWVVMKTYGGRLTENIVQAVAHDILRFAITNLRAAGYPTVLHVYDEILVQIPEGTGSVEEVERIMQIMPWWAQGWPIRAAGGWRGKRYRKG